jgi:UDPglucose--hexose-1-phosphate uridylyltransferase
VIAPRRADRPGARATPIEPATPEELETCPFCAGREDRTPPETLRIGEPWQVRVVPNLYPAFEAQEVVVHTPEHVRAFADLTDESLAAVAAAWRERAGAAPGYVHALINEGRAAGASLAHTHSQLVRMAEPPPAVVREESRLRAASCALCRLLEDDRHRIAEQEGVVLLAHPAGRVPYELLLASREHVPDGFGEGLPAALGLLRTALAGLRSIEGHVPWNAWLHHGAHWHFEVMPRMTVAAGIELGAGIYVNPLPPEQAAEALRSASPS